MTTLHIDSVVQEDGSIVIPSNSFSPGTHVHVVVTTDEEKQDKKYTIDDLLAKFTGILADCDPESVENSRMEYLLEKYQ